MDENEQLVCEALLEGPLTGYQIIKRIEALTDGRKQLRVAALYVAIDKLRRDDAVRRGPWVQINERTRLTWELGPGGRGKRRRLADSTPLKPQLEGFL